MAKRSKQIKRTKIVPFGGPLPHPKQDELEVVAFEVQKPPYDAEQETHKHRLRSLTLRDTVGYAALMMIIVGSFLVWIFNISPDHNAVSSHILTLCVGGLLGKYFSGDSHS